MRIQLEDAQETLRAIRSGEVDAVVVAGKNGPQVFTLDGAEHAYRVLIESMNEGALTLTADKTILYANERFASMVRSPLEQVIGNSLRRFLSVEDRKTVRRGLQRADKAGCKFQVPLKASDGSQLPVLISMRPLAESGPKGAVACMIVTDMTEARRNETLLRDLSHRLMTVQEIERGRVAVELHDHITQLLCAVVIRVQTLSDTLPPPATASRAEIKGLREMLGRVAEEVESISRGLQPSVLNDLGLLPVLRSTAAAFEAKTGVTVKVSCTGWTGELSSEAGLALYRVVQEALANTERHAGARNVTVRLAQRAARIEMTISDDGNGFDPEPRPAKQAAKNSFGLLSMRERVAGVGGAFSVSSAKRKGTTIRVAIPTVLKKRRAG